MAGMWAWVRAEAKAQLRASLVVVLLVGLGAGVAIAAVAGARRTDTAFDRLLAATQAATHRVQYSTAADVDDEILTRLAEDPAVAVVVPIHQLLGFSDASRFDIGILASPDPRFGNQIDRLRLQAGRLPAFDADHEVAITRTLADDAGLQPGDVLTVATFTPEQVAEFTFGEPGGPTLELTVVGVGLLPDELADEQMALAFPSPAFAHRYLGEVGGFGPSLELRIDETADADDVIARAFAGIELDEGPEVLTAERRGDLVSDATGTMGTGLLLFAAVAAAATALGGSQAIGRRLAVAARDQPVLRAVGVTRRQRGLALVGAALPVVLAGSALALGVAIAGSSVMPLGLAGRAEPDRGIDVDVPVVALGLVLTTAILLVLVAAAAVRLSRPDTERATRRPERPSALAALARAAGWSPPAVIGVTMALEPDRGRTGVPVRPAILGAVAGIAGVVAALVFGASLDRLVTTPAAYGWNWSLLPDLDRAGAQDLAGEPAVEDLGLLRVQQVALAGEEVLGMAIEVVKGRPSFSIVSGRMPVSAGEVAVGPVTLERADAAVGDVVALAGPDQEIEVTVVGLALFPDIDENPFNDGVVLSPELVDDAAVSDGFATAVVGLADGVDPADGAELIDRVLPGAITPYSFPSRPPDVENLAQVSRMPLVLAGFLVMLAITAVAHYLLTSMRARRRDLGLTRALGLRRGQVRVAVAVQSLTVVVIGLVVGFPLGIAAGRLAWAALADTVGIHAVPVVQPILLLVIPAGVVCGLALAGLTSRETTTPGHALRTE